MIEIHRVDAAWVPRTWPHVSAYLESALAHPVDINVDDLRVFCGQGTATLFVAVKEGKIQGAAVVEIFNRGTNRVAFVLAMGGRLISSQDTFSQFKQHLVSMGATQLEGAVKESVARLWSRYGFTEKHRIVGVSLWAEAAEAANKPQ